MHYTYIHIKLIYTCHIELPPIYILNNVYMLNEKSKYKHFNSNNKQIYFLDVQKEIIKIIMIYIHNIR